MEMTLVDRILVGAFFAFVFWYLWKTVATTRWHKAFMLFCAALALYFLTMERMVWV